MCMSIYFMSYVYVHIFYIVRLFHGSRGGDLRACTYILYCWAFFMARVAVGCMCIYAYIIYMYMSMYRAVYVTAHTHTNTHRSLKRLSSQQQRLPEAPDIRFPARTRNQLRHCSHCIPVRLHPSLFARHASLLSRSGRHTRRPSSRQIRCVSRHQAPRGSILADAPDFVCSGGRARFRLFQCLAADAGGGGLGCCARLPRALGACGPRVPNPSLGI